MADVQRAKRTAAVLNERMERCEEMEFNKPRLLKNLCDMPASLKKMTTEQFYDRLAEKTIGGMSDRYDASIATEIDYIFNRQPFYNVYPSIVRSLENTSLDFKLCQIGKEFRATAICFAKSNELEVSTGVVESMFISMGLPDAEIANGWLMIVVFHETRNGKHTATLGAGANDVLSSLLQTDDDFNPNLNDQDFSKILSIAAGVMLLSSDPELAEPILLKRDQGKEFKTQADLDIAIARAKRRGVNGHAIGKNLVVSPHTRRPHFGIRWTGKGRTTPKLVPVKGCIIKREAVVSVPTGYDGEASS